MARSYLAALDLLVPVEASVSGVIGSETPDITDVRLKTIRDRYKSSMAFLTSPDDTIKGAGRTKVETYVLKQTAWAEQVALYAKAQAQAIKDFQPPQGATTAQIRDAKERYMEWVQENARNVSPETLFAINLTSNLSIILLSSKTTSKPDTWTGLSMATSSW